MKIVLVRHGEADYSYYVNNGYFGMGLNLAGLSENGIKQSEYIIPELRLFGNIDLIVSSPYTRALQTASIISRNLNIPISVENRLNEWIPDLSFNNTMEEERLLSEEFFTYNGKWPQNTKKKWENIDMFSKRIIEALKKFLAYERVIVVTHAAVIHHLTGLDSVPYCCLKEINFDNDFKPCGWFKR